MEAVSAAEEEERGAVPPRSCLSPKPSDAFRVLSTYGNLGF